MEQNFGLVCQTLPLVDAGLDTVVSYGYHTALDGIAPTMNTVSWTPAATVVDNTSLITEARPLENVAIGGSNPSEFTYIFEKASTLLDAFFIQYLH